MEISSSAQVLGASAHQTDKLWNTAKKLEAVFLTEMLKHTGIGETSASFGGGAGESQFASFLTQEHATLMTEAGGIGLAELLFESMTERAK